jgi:DNA-binding NarL/FixJ family response regulator
MTKIKVLIADDHAVVRTGLKLLISVEPDLEVAGEAENGKVAVELTKRLRPDVVLMDFAMPQCNGAKATQSITRQYPATKVLVLSAYHDEDTVRALLKAGAAGYLTKDSASGDLVQAIREVKRGNCFFSPAIAKRMRSQWQNSFQKSGAAGREGALSSREGEVLVLIARGYANKQIAGELGISIKTVEKHRQQVMEKLGIHDIAGLTRYSLSKGLLGFNGQAIPPTQLELGDSRSRNAARL